MKRAYKIVCNLFLLMLVVVPSGLYGWNFTFKKETGKAIELKVQERRYGKSFGSCRERYTVKLDPAKGIKSKNRETKCCIPRILARDEGETQWYQLWSGSMRCGGTATIIPASERGWSSEGVFFEWE